MKKIKAILGLFGILTIMASLSLSALPASQVSAQQITARSLTLQVGTTPSDVNADGINDGGSTPGATVDHLIKFTLPQATSNLGSIKFQYCMTAADVGAATCVMPTGMHTNTVTGIDDNTSGVTGWSLGAGQPDGTVLITRTADSQTGPISMSIQLQNVTNPIDNTNYPNGMTFFVRISSYATADGSGSATDTGTVAAATVNQVQLKGTMPESLVFCTGDKISTTNGVPDCTTATNNLVNFNQLFSPTSVAFATSQMAASTNAGSGYAITVNGPTMKSGTNQINPINQANDTYDASAASPWSEPSRLGISQFGMNVVKNDATADYSVTNPTQTPPTISGNGTEPDSANVTPASGTGNYNGAAAAGYDTNGYFKFQDGDTVATSSNTYTDAQIYTASYIVNVPGSQAAGDYQTTLTYICTPTF